MLINTTKAVKSVRFIGGNIVIKAGAWRAGSRHRVFLELHGGYATKGKRGHRGYCSSAAVALSERPLSADYKMNISASALEVTGVNGAPALVTPDNFTVNDIICR